MRVAKTALQVAVMLCWSVSSAFAQRDHRTYVHVDLGYGSMDDDQGGLGRGLALGAAVGGVIVDDAQAEFCVTRMHHERSLVTSWDGNITSYTGRVTYRTGGSGSTTRLFAGVGAGYYSYSGVITETIFPTMSAPVVDRFDYAFHGFTYETGGGIEFVAGRNAFIRPELWVTIPRGSRTSGGRTPEPPFLIARGAVVAGLRF